MTNLKPEDYQAALAWIDKHPRLIGYIPTREETIIRSALTRAAQPSYDSYNAESKVSENHTSESAQPNHAELEATIRYFESQNFMDKFGTSLTHISVLLQAARSQLSGQSDGGVTPVSSQVSDRKADVTPPQDGPNFFKSGKIKHNSEINKKECGCWYDEKSGSGMICSNHAPKSWSNGDAQPPVDAQELDEAIACHDRDSFTHPHIQTLVKAAKYYRQSLGSMELLEALETIMNSIGGGSIAFSANEEPSIKARAAIAKYKSQSLGG